MRKNICVVILLAVSLSLLNTSNGWAWWGKRDCHHSQWSPDGKKIAFISGTITPSDVAKLPLLPFVLFNPYFLHFFEGVDGLYVMNIDGSHKKRIAKNIYRKFRTGIALHSQLIETAHIVGYPGYAQQSAFLITNSIK